MVNNISVEQVQETKLLGITINHTLSWSNHIDNTVSRMGRGVSVARRISRGMPLEVIKQVLNALVLSQLDYYCFVIWLSASMKDMRKLQVVQNKAARCALQCSYTTNVKDMHNSLRWLTVRQRAHYVLLNFLRNIMVTQSPRILYRRLLPNFAQHEHQTRHATEGRFILPRANTCSIQKTVIYRAMERWNSLPVYIVHENTKERFKMLLKQHLVIFHE